jgi:hypothetical protein
MNFYPQIREWGKLELIEIYEFYDKPLLVSCRNAAGKIFIALLVDEDVEAETWYFVQVSQQRFEHVRAGLLELRGILTNPEQGYIVEVRIPADDRKPATSRYLAPETLTEARLPEPGEFIEINTRSPELYPVAS